ncbi:hypothetical protein EJF36_12790 [Bacillus sp. HMF5848]|uniref:VLRF1 family aeRF1-type release factor n=1 Tax=Bacillus sp. HMF5848 TaxID=2495421 RepID=UPI000F76D353|nr:VLRF1 family aeRF1-type release factor [Bacillus sp. HMF5848]RSK27679.1 hypothetical protein EJF36_12790 [Bacillus sp. HMF5848]
MDTLKRLDKLSNITFEKPNKVLSLYVNTDRSHPDNQAGEWKIALKNGFNRLEEYLQASNTEELENIKLIREQVESYFINISRSLPRSVVIFTNKDQKLWEVFELQVPVRTNFYWETEPVLDELRSVYEQHPYTAVVLMQQNQIKILTSVFASLLQTESYEYELDNEDWKKHEGPSHVSASMGSGAVKSATQVDHFDNRVKVNQQRWLKSLGSMIDKKAADEKWNKIILVGDSESIDYLEGNMNKTIDEKIQKNLLNENEHTVLEKIVV